MISGRFDDKEWAPVDIRELEVGSELGILISLQAEPISRVRQVSFLFSYCNKKNSSKDIFSILFYYKR
jgi:hypothetical protein